jgi:catechol 2,3-dioxygenase-like lactoylglutathione lyase family enzyme
MAEVEKPRLVGFNHIALEVGDIDEALAFYGRLFKFELRGKSDSMAFIDLGDQFRRAAGSRQTMVATLASSSKTRRHRGRHLTQLVLRRSTGPSLIFEIPGATA